MNDATTFFLAFLAVFGGLGAYLWHLDRAAHRLEQRLAALETAQGSKQPRGSATAKAKPPQPPA